ncbi:hypothetical protein BDP81DRAFT_401029 [Colletotrichum phormii]|uniref:F-box domain-containing protein n=1 Tax=Colletotrichum phormii TaxID=359342 RepID=A0AAI9ZBU7_9PEZI|nr:uncharacterized protein BDP81DRAFT_401029 [Colletotrichum phormii]KAK1621649.1 hypothetical protein BDP81DRAFT_401029 [Colletotrichum phormii]
MAELRNLPPETILHIVSYLLPDYTPGKELLDKLKSDCLIQKELCDQRRALASLARTCRRYYNLLIPFLYESVSVHCGASAPRQWLSLMKTLLHNKDLCRLVKQLYIHFDSNRTLVSPTIRADAYVRDMVSLETWLKKVCKPNADISRPFEVSSAFLFTLASNTQDFTLSASGLSLSASLDAIHDVDQILPNHQTSESTFSSLKSVSLRKGHWDPSSHWTGSRERWLTARFITRARNLREAHLVRAALEFPSPPSTNLTTLALSNCTISLPILANAIRACPKLEKFFWKKQRRWDLHPHTIPPWLILGALGIRRATLRTLVIDFDGVCGRGTQVPAVELSTFTNLEEAWVDISVFDKDRGNYTDSESDPLNLTVVEGSPLIRTLPSSIRKLHLSGAMTDFIYEEVLWLARAGMNKTRHIPEDFALDGGYLDGDMFNLYDHRNDDQHLPTTVLDRQPFLW